MERRGPVRYQLKRQSAEPPITAMQKRVVRHSRAGCGLGGCTCHLREDAWGDGQVEDPVRAAALAFLLCHGVRQRSEVFLQAKRKHANGREALRLGSHGQRWAADKGLSGTIQRGRSRQVRNSKFLN